MNAPLARRTRPEFAPDPMTTPQQQPPDEPVSFSRLLIWGTIAIVLVLGIWLYVRYGREVAPLISA